MNIRLRPSIRYLLVVACLFSIDAPSFAEVCGLELCPGRIRNPPGWQFTQATAYNENQDDYLLATTSNGSSIAYRMDPEGNLISGEIALGGGGGVAEVRLSFNPEANEYLFVLRKDDPLQVYGIYLDGNGVPITSPFLIATGVAPAIAYNSNNHTFMLVYTRYASGSPSVRYQMLGGSSTASPRFIGSERIVRYNALSPSVAFGAVSDKFLVVYGQELAVPERGAVLGNFVTGDGATIGPLIGIATGYENQGNPFVAYADAHDRWLVTFDDWSNIGPAIGAHFVNTDRSVSGRFYVTGANGWHVPGPISYVAGADVFVASWWVVSWASAIVVDPVDGSLGNEIRLNNVDGKPAAVTARPDLVDPQALYLTRTSFGDDGIHAHIIDVPLGPPQFSDTKMRDGFRDVYYEEALRVFGGTAPLTYTPISGSPAPGLSGPDAAGKIKGTPTTVGSFGSYRVRVTDAEGRWVEETLTHDIRLAPPVPVSPSGLINEATPTFDWDPNPNPPGYTATYELVVENATTAEVVFTETIIGNTEYTPTSPLATDVAYRWYVTAADGGIVSPPSDTMTFDVDLVPPEAVTLVGSIPRGTLEPVSGVVAIASSGHDGFNPPSQAVDANNSTVWSTPGRTSMQNEWITLDLGAPSTVGLVKMHARVDNGAFFPRDFKIELSDDNVNFTEVYAENDFVAAANTNYSFTVEHTTGRYLRIFITESNLHPTLNQYYVQIAEIEVHAETFITHFGATASSVSSEVAGYTREKVIDGDPNSYWSTPGTSGMAEEQITLDFGTMLEFSRVSLRSRHDLGTYFPRDFQIQFSSDNVDFVTAYEENGFAADPATWYPFDINPTEARYLRIRVTGSNLHPMGLYFVQIAEIEAALGLPVPRSIRIDWHAPGNDLDEGSAKTYDIRYMADDPDIDTDTFDWDTATEATGEPQPSPAGKKQFFTIEGLDDEQLYWIAMKSIDEATNVSDLSNVVHIATLGTPPPAIDDLTPNDVTDTTVRLTWDAVGDDGETGEPAELYDLRYSTTPINNETDFENATPVMGEPVPKDPDDVELEEMVISNLIPDTSYYFAITVKDDADLESPLSNVASFRTVDTAPPATIGDLAADAPSGFVLSQTPAIAVSSSGEASPSTKDKAVDSDPSTVWSTPGRPTMREEQITLDLGAVMDVGGLRMLSRADNGTYFPVSFEIQLSNEPDANFHSVASVSGLSSANGQLHSFDITPVSSGRYLRIRVTESNMHPTGSYYVQIAEIEIDQAVPIPTDGVQLTWTAPGDSRMEGTAVEYDLRWSTTEITGDADFDAIIDPLQIVLLTPQPAGSPEEYKWMGLDAETTYYFAMKSSDNESNVSAMSNVASATTAGVAPAAVSTLTATTGTNPGEIKLEWQPTGDDGNGSNGKAASSYDIRYSKNPITNEAEFAAADQVTNEPVPVPPTFPPNPPVTQEKIVTGLDADTVYYFVMKVLDEVPNTSPMSNQDSARTQDTLAPATVVLNASIPSGFDYSRVVATAKGASGASGVNTPDKVVDGTPVVWSTPGRSAMQVEWITLDLGSEVNVGRVRMIARADNGAYFPRDFQIQVSSNNVAFASIHTAANVTAAPGQSFQFNIASPQSGRYMRIYVTRSNQHPAGLFYVQIAEIEVDKATAIPSTSAVLTWTAPGDSGTEGTATKYDIRWNETGIANDAAFDAITDPLQRVALTPKTAGTPETYTLTGLPAETQVYIAMRVEDEVPNVSGLSNVENVTTGGVAPAAVSTLTATTGTNPGEIKLEWQPTGDDGNGSNGKAASSYDIRYSNNPITNEAEFAAADQVTNEPTPVPPTFPPDPPVTQEKIVTGLDADTEYYFVMKVLDEVLNTSPMSNQDSARTEDTLAPAAVALTASIPSGFDYSGVVATANSASGASGANTPDKVVDGTPVVWSTPGRSAMQVEWVTLDLGSEVNVGRVRMLARADNGAYFPRDFQIQVSSNNVDFTSTHTAANVTAAPGQWFEFNIASPQSGRYMRIYVTRSNQHPAGLYYVQIAEIEIDEATAIPSTSAVLTWTAPGDSGTEGTATKYDIRWNETGISSDADFDAITDPQQMVELTPQAPGTPETFTLTGLPAETQVYIAMRAEDEVPNVSGLSNVENVTTGGVAPAAVSTLTATTGTNPGEIKLEWQPTGDDGNGSNGKAASSYDIRYSNNPITNEAEFAAADQVTNEPTPVPPTFPPDPPVTQEKIVTGLDADTEYYFVMKVLDEVLNTSPMSNQDSARTEDTLAPAAVALTASIPSGFDYSGVVATANSASGASGANTPDKVVDGTPVVWSTPGRSAMQVEWVTLDLGSEVNVGRVRMLARADNGAYFPRDFQIQVSSNNVDFTSTHTAANVTAAPGQWFEFNIASPQSGRYMRIYVTRSNQHPAGLYYVQIAEIEIDEATAIPSTSAVLTWTAPGDSGTEGTATKYDIRWNETGISNDTDFDAITDPQQMVELTPQAPGTPETFTLTGLPAETQVYIAMRAEDEVPNVSGLSNVENVTTGGVAPAAVSTLTATTGTNPGEIKLEWQPTGDDGNGSNGKAASSYDIRYSNNPITNEAEFAAADQVTNEPTPVPPTFPPDPPVTQEKIVTGLDADTEYYFVMKVLDEVLNTSPMSNQDSARTEDTLAPAAVALTASIPSGFDYSGVVATANSASGASGANTPDKVVDGTPVVWSTPGRSAMQVEWITLDLGSEVNVGRVRMLARADNGAYFPRDFQIQVSSNNVDFTSTHTAANVTAAPGQWFEFNIASPQSGRYMRIYVTRSNQHPTGLYYVQIAEIEIDEATAIPSTSAVLTWTAPGDSGMIGTATKYDIRWNTTGISSDADFDAITDPQQMVELTPQAPGTPETYTLTGFPEASNVYIAIRVEDEVPNAVLSNTVMLEIPCVTLCSVLPTSRLVWDPSPSQNVTKYNIHVSQASRDYDLENPAGTVPAFGPLEWPLDNYSFEVGTHYYAVVTAADDLGNQSSFSNEVDFTIEPFTGMAIMGETLFSDQNAYPRGVRDLSRAPPFQSSTSW